MTRAGAGTSVLCLASALALGVILTAGAPAATTLAEPAVSSRAISLGRGRTHLSLRVRHVPQRGSSPVSARWFIAQTGSNLFRLVAITPTRELEPGLTYADVTVDPPSAHFSYRVCLGARSTQLAGGHAPLKASCPSGDYRSQGSGRLPGYEGEGEGIPLAAYPSSAAIAAAERFLDARAGRTSFAVVDSQGHVSGVRLHEHFQTASVVKVMMLAAYLRKLSAEHRGLDAGDRVAALPDDPHLRQ